MRRLRWLIVTMLAVAGLVAVPAARADYGKAVYQITISANCDNPSLCGTNLGGFWGWAALQGTADGPGTGDSQFTGCGHTVGGGGPGLAGASHESQNFTWAIAPGSAGPRTLYLTSETDVFDGHGGGTQVIPSEMADQGVPLPDAPGSYHYEIASQAFGFSGPGVHFKIQVVRLPNT